VIGERNIQRNNNDGDDDLERLQNQINTIENEYSYGINKRNHSLINQGYVDSTKHQDCIRFLFLNPRGFGPDKEEKVEMMLEAIKRYDLDGVMLSSTDRKWSSTSIKQMKRIFRRISPEIEIATSDSGQEARTARGYLPGGTLTMVFGRAANIKVQNYVKTDPKGRWNAIRLEAKNKILQIFTVYRIPESTAPGILKSRA